MATFNSMWSGQGELQVEYSGPKLEEGEYAIKIKDKYITFMVATKDDASSVEAALVEAQKLSSSLSKSDQIAIQAGIWAQAGMPSEALYLIDDALKASPEDKDLMDIQRSYERMGSAQ